MCIPPYFIYAILVYTCKLSAVAVLQLLNDVDSRSTRFLLHSHCVCWHSKGPRRVATPASGRATVAVGRQVGDEHAQERFRWRRGPANAAVMPLGARRSCRSDRLPQGRIGPVNVTHRRFQAV